MIQIMIQTRQKRGQQRRQTIPNIGQKDKHKTHITNNDNKYQQT